MEYTFLYRHSGNRMAIIDVQDVRMSREHTDVQSDRNPEFSKVYWMPGFEHGCSYVARGRNADSDNSFAVSGMTLCMQVGQQWGVWIGKI